MSNKLRLTRAYRAPTAPPAPLPAAQRSARLIAVAASLIAQVATPGAAFGALVESVTQVAVSIHTLDGRTVTQSVALAMVREESAAPHPFLIIEHGRPTDAAGRAAMGLQSYPANARYFAALGFVVLIPTRIGYGISRGPDVEYTGECAFKHYDGGIGAAMQETRQVAAYAASLPFVDGTRGLIVGESFGGLLAIAAAAGEVPGVVGAVNISGGDGGDSVNHVDQPCRADQLEQMFARFGQRNKVPTLWIYSENDRLWGPKYPRQWYGAYVAQGGNGVFTELGPDKNNGHYIFNRNAPAWHPPFERFLQQLPLSIPAR